MWYIFEQIKNSKKYGDLEFSRLKKHITPTLKDIPDLKMDFILDWVEFEREGVITVIYFYFFKAFHTPFSPA